MRVLGLVFLLSFAYACSAEPKSGVFLCVDPDKSCPGGMLCGADGVCRDTDAPDAAVLDAVILDAIIPDAIVPDAVVPDAVVPDAIDGAVPDAIVPDAVVPDAIVPDAIIPDATVPVVSPYGATLPEFKPRSAIRHNGGVLVVGKANTPDNLAYAFFRDGGLVHGFVRSSPEVDRYDSVVSDGPTAYALGKIQNDILVSTIVGGVDTKTSQFEVSGAEVLTDATLDNSRGVVIGVGRSRAMATIFIYSATAETLTIVRSAIQGTFYGVAVHQDNLYVVGEEQVSDGTLRPVYLAGRKEMFLSTGEVEGKRVQTPGFFADVEAQGNGVVRAVGQIGNDGLVATISSNPTVLRRITGTRLQLISDDLVAGIVGSSVAFGSVLRVSAGPFPYEGVLGDHLGKAGMLLDTSVQGSPLLVLGKTNGVVVHENISNLAGCSATRGTSPVAAASVNLTPVSTNMDAGEIVIGTSLATTFADIRGTDNADCN